jgi:hypothetical protein
MSDKANKIFNAEQSLDEFQKLSIPAPETFSESLKMMSKMVQHFQKIYDSGYEKGYRDAIKKIDL